MFWQSWKYSPTRQGKRRYARTKWIYLRREPDGFDISTRSYRHDLGYTGGTEYFSLSKAITLSGNDVSEERGSGGRLSGMAVLVLGSVVSCAPHGTVVTVRTLNWLNVATTPSGLSSVSRRLSREFRLG